MRRQKCSIEQQVKNLRQKQREFNTKKDYERATHAKIIADFLEEYVTPAPAMREVIV